MIGVAPARPWRRTLLALVGIAVLVWLSWHARTNLLRVLTSTSPTGIAFAVAAGIALNLFYGLQFDALLAKQGGGHDRHRRVAAYLLAQPGKYLPGKIWSAVMQSFALGRDSRLATIAIANIELTAIAIVQTTGLGVACLQPRSPLLVLTALVAASLATLAIALLPTVQWLVRIAPSLQRWLKLPAKSETLLPESHTRLLALAVAALACNFAASWCLLWAARAMVAPEQLLPLLATLYLGVAASLLALPVPAGLGVREAAVAGLGSLIAPDVAPTLVISIALLARCWQLLVDVTCLVIGWLLLRFATHRIEQ